MLNTNQKIITSQTHSLLRSLHCFGVAEMANQICFLIISKTVNNVINQTQKSSKQIVGIAKKWTCGTQNVDIYRYRNE